MVYFDTVSVDISFICFEWMESIDCVFHQFWYCNIKRMLMVSKIFIIFQNRTYFVWVFFVKTYTHIVHMMYSTYCQLVIQNVDWLYKTLGLFSNFVKSFAEISTITDLCTLLLLLSISNIRRIGKENCFSPHFVYLKS